jgi:hypothetical protein
MAILSSRRQANRRLADPVAQYFKALDNGDTSTTTWKHPSTALETQAWCLG